MAYFVGNVNGDRASCSGKSGFVTVETSPNNSDLLIVSGGRRRYPVFMNTTAKGAMQGEKMFKRYAVKVVVSKERCHVWILRMGAPQRKSGMSSTRRYQPRTYGSRQNYSRRRSY